MVAPKKRVEPDIPQRITNRARRRIKKLIPKMVIAPRGQSVRNLITHESDCLLTQREQLRIRERIEWMEAGGRVELKHLDFRYWEIRRRTGWNPDDPDAQWGTVYLWWCQLSPIDRGIIADLSRGAGMRDSGGPHGQYERRKRGPIN